MRKPWSEASQIDRDAFDLQHFGYQQKLRRTIGAYASFALGFSMISITTRESPRYGLRTATNLFKVDRRLRRSEKALVKHG